MKSILEEAAEIRRGDRNADYGDAVENFERISEIVYAMTGQPVSPRMCCYVHLATKISRHRHKPKRDNLVDLCGYADILNLIEESDHAEPGNDDYAGTSIQGSVRRTVDAMTIISQYASACGFTCENIIAPGRQINHHVVRQLIYIRLKADGYSYSAIGRMFNRNHSSIMSAINDARNLIEINDPLIMDYADAISVALSEPHPAELLEIIAEDSNKTAKN